MVYKALDLRLQRHVALKVLPTDVSSDAARRRRFLQEARAASALNDPHIVTVYDVFEHDGTDVIVMELVEGRTLREAATPHVPIVEALAWVGQVADAMVVAHAAGIIHRDLKPGNIMITDRGLVKVLDFGLAKVAVGADDVTVAPLTVDGDVFGTVEYMSPEQARGGLVDHRSDIFSLGTILYELLAGRRPFEGENKFAVLHEILHGQVIPVRRHRAEVSAPVEAVVMRALERDLAARFQSMREFVSALRTAETAPAVAPVPRRRPYAPVAGGALAAAVVVLAVLWLQPQQWLRRSLPAAASAMPAAATVAAPVTSLEHTQHGLGLLRRFDRARAVEQAISSFETAITLDNTFAPAWAGLARAYWRQQKDTRDASLGARAMDAANQAIALDPYLADAHVSLGLARFVSGDVPAAKAAFEHGLVLDPANAGAHRGLGDIAEGEDRLSEAATHYQKAVELDPADWELPRLLGDIPYQAAKYAEALKWYSQAAAAAPDSAVPFRLMGAASHMLGDYPAAASAFQKSLAIQSTPAGYTNLGTALFYQGLYRESLQAFERAVEMAPSNPLVWGNVADAYRWVPGNTQQSLDSYARAVQLLRQQLEKDPKHIANRSRLALYLAKSGETSAGLAELAGVLTPDVREVNTLYRGAVTYELAGDRDAALRTLEIALNRGYAVTEVQMDPELAKLRNDVRYHRLAARFESAGPPKQ